jgi:tetratricopeptide (TPR) repeat protein
VSRARAARDLARNDAERASTASLFADTLNQFGRAGEAVAYAREARDLDDTHDRRMQLANILGEAGFVEEGLQLIRRERLKRPNDPYMLNTLGYYLIENTDRLEEGYKVLHAANAMARNDAYIADSLGWAYYKLGHLDDALRLIEISRDELSPKLHWEIEDHYGDILWHLDRREEAREAWRRALGEFPPHETEMTIRRKLEDGLSGPPPEKQDLPRISLDDQDVQQRKT